MSGFVASPPTPAPGSADEVEADGWYPAVSLSAMRASMRVGMEASEPRVRDAILAGITSAMNDLAAWRDLQTADALADVADLDARGAPRKLGGQPRLVQLWRRAVTSYAQADLLESHRTVSATMDGAKSADQEICTADDHRRNGLAATRDMIGTSRSAVVLL